MSTNFLKGRLLAKSMLAAVGAPLAVAAATTILAPVASAQDYTSGSVTGSVSSEEGASVSGATITLTSAAQGFQRTATSDASGGFRIGSLPQGTYEVSVSAPGYEILTDSAISVVAGASSNYTLTLRAEGSTQETIVVTGVKQNLDFSGTTQGLNIDVEALARDLPIGRNLTSLTLLAPSVVSGDTTFGNLAAIAGSSVAENAYYLNGLNLTNFDNYIGSSLVPFEFYQSVEVKTSAYPAEYGRATGGILNAVTKSGTNEFKGALRFNYSPDSLQEDAPDTFAQRNQLDESEAFSAIAEIGGPIIKDRLFFYAMTEVRDTETKDAGILSRTQSVDSSDDPFYGLKLDGYITDNHHLEFTYLDTTRTTTRKTFAYNPSTDAVGAQTGGTVFENGGESYVAKYTGTLTNWLTISGAYGVNNDQALALPLASGPLIADSRTGIGGIIRSPQTTQTITNPRETERTFYRADADMYFDLAGQHHVRAGYEKEELYFARSSVRTGPDGVTYIYRTATATDPRANGPGGVPVGTEYVEVNYFNSGGEFDSENTAFYIQDQWDVNDQLTLNLGVRLDQFANFTADGSQFIDFDEEIGPRLGFTYDPTGNGRTKIFGNYCVYFLPVASNTAFRQGAAEYFFREYYTFTNDPTSSLPPVLGTQLLDWQGANPCPFGIFGPDGANGCAVTGDGTAQNPIASISQNLKATEQEEFVIGFQTQLTDLWTVGAAFTYRDLKETAEDVAVDAAVLAYCDAEGIAGCDAIWTGFHQYTILNPGQTSIVTLSDPLPGETELRTITMSAQDLGYPLAKRTYSALELSFERAFDDGWGLRGSYTLSESTGNSEGYVKSDNGQTDSGITQDFDTPNLMDGADGLLPNHRAHAFKLFGSYQVTDNLLVGANATLVSPRKFGCLGLHPEGYDPGNGQFDPAQLYGAAANYCGGQLVPRGTAFESDWNKTLDVSFRYNLPLESRFGVVLRADIFNLFNFQSKLDFDEFGEEDNGDVNPFYRLPTGYQTPRGVRLGFDVTF